MAKNVHFTIFWTDQKMLSGGSYHWGNFPGGIIRGNYAGGNFPRGQLSGGNYPGQLSYNLASKTVSYFKNSKLDSKCSETNPS